MSKLTRQEVQAFLEEASNSFPHGACLECECFLGYVVRLQIDAEAAGRDLTRAYQVERNQIHACFGCDPCPPGNLYAAYIRKKGQPLITL